ncbi:hypothetical protein TWF730_007088 [Orbilia blumenaviensis]|uniref:Uncharacterized protein n=1 Tax=Orbilia blumenaviensis TaxID=1796055 RepID=A0AAV9VHF0_9PEZI
MASQVQDISDHAQDLPQKEGAMPTLPFRLFDLPLEIRELIYLHLTDISRAPLEPDLKSEIMSPASAVNFDYTQRPANRLVIIRVPLAIYYPTRLPRYSLLPVLQTCRQLRSEFQRFISLLQLKPGGGPNPLGYTLNVEAYDAEVFLKWTRLQLPPEQPYNIIPEYRINYNVCGLQSRLECPLRFSITGVPGDEVLALFNLLNDLLNHGPQGFYKPSLNGGEGGGRCAEVFIQKLVLDISFTFAPMLQNHIQSYREQTPVPNSTQSDIADIIITGMHQFKMDIMKGFKDWMSTFISIGHLDGVVGSVQILWDGAEEWEAPPDLSDPENPVSDQKMTAFFDLAGTERKLEIIEPLSWERYRWGRKERFQISSKGPAWKDRWVEMDGVWVPPDEVPRWWVRPREPAEEVAPAAVVNADEPVALQRLREEVDFLVANGLLPTDEPPNEQ